MFDDALIEVGKIQKGYLTDEQGRRIYFPLLGPARLVPSRGDEAKFRERMIFAAIAIIIGYVLGSALNAFWLEDLVSPSIERSIRVSWPLALMVICVFGSQLLVPPWAPVSESEDSPDSYVVTILARRSSSELWMMVILRTLVFLGLLAAPVIWFMHPKFDWSAASGLESCLHVLPSLLLLTIVPLASRSAWRVVRALGKRFR